MDTALPASPCPVRRCRQVHLNGIVAAFVQKLADLGDAFAWYDDVGHALCARRTKAAATDGHRLARVTLPRPAGAEGMPDIIVPRKCVAEIRKLLDESGDNSIQVDLSASKIRFTFDSVILTSKLIDGTFPDYSRVIPTANDKLLRIDPKAFSQGVDRVATIATEKTRAVIWDQS